METNAKTTSGALAVLGGLAAGALLASKLMQKVRHSSATSSVQETIEIDVPLSTAYNQWTQFEEFPRFMESVEAVRQIDDTQTPGEKIGDAIGAVKLTAKGNLKRFKELVERRGVETGAWRGTVVQR